MKVDVVARRRGRGAADLAACSVVAAAWLCGAALAAGPLGPSERPEAYFNGSSYIRLSKPISLKQLVGLSFRTCEGGELFSQRYEGYTLHVTALFEQVVVSWARPFQEHQEVALDKKTLDNQWHWVALKYKPNPPSLLLEVDKDTQVISNVTWNPELLSPGALEAEGAVLLVGNVFSGCIHEGPQLEFHAQHAQVRHVHFGHCPLATDECKDRKDVFRTPPKDHCYNEPCLRHGTCISRSDRYECHCTARYTGNNCEVDAGDPCASAPCRHAGRCLEDARGDYLCDCPPNYHGEFCELEVSLDPLCVAGPCLNNGSCNVPAGADTYVCTCPPGYSGRNCETDVDECAGAAGACLNGGRCLDAVNNFTCNCTGTGYVGARCEVNVNECAEERGVCGHGVCYDTYGGFVCACQPGYTGERCQDKMSACAAGPCGAGGVCVDEPEGGGFRCVCAKGLVPPLCTPPPAASCADLACPPHSHCMLTSAPGVLVKQVTCICDVGFYGAPGLAPNCSTVEAACDSGVCLNGAACALAPAGDHFNCTCAPGYKGVYCEAGAGAGTGKALQELRAERCAAAPCAHAAACHDLQNGGFQCECEPGWSGARCDSAVADTCAARACLNGGSCREGAGGAACECRAGFAGALCETPADCRAASCPPHQECMESGGSWRCVPAPADSACASSPCHNGTCLALGAAGAPPAAAALYKCTCPPGATGKYCEIDIDECIQNPKICNHGVCVNVAGSYQCYCRPGYTGDNCEQDIDECLSSPCKHGGSCVNLENNYECTCMEGFEGKDCSVNINECESSPCAAGSTCVDGVNSYACVCQDGLTGPNCEVDIDDCESEPCMHAGRCQDGLNSFTCDCAGTGYSGEQCDVNIDECAPAPCRHGGTCLDDVNDYRCECYPAYAGKNCEIDIAECASAPCKYGGVCLERSNGSLYLPPDAPPVQVGPQPHMLLPPLFYQPFSLDTASGFECVCVEGTLGARCETNVDECASAPCAHGKCIDGVGEYRCECLPGYEGDHCQLEVDECARYQPCSHGRCIDGRASYFCVCEEGYGGQNCTVVLEGCRAQPCRNNGSCQAWLRHETEHRFNCSCAPGHLGTTCEKITTMSLEKWSYAEVNTSREEGYDISFRFKTTLGSGLLAMGRGLTYFFLELSNGRLNLHSSLLNKWEGVFIGSNLNDSNWQKVFVTINSSHLVLAANEEQTIYPISQLEAFNSSVTSFPSTRLGTAGSSYATLTHGPNFFVGCFQDVIVNGQPVLPEDSGPESGEATTPAGEEREARAVLSGVLASCPRTPQCSPNPCRSGGLCADNWSSFACACPRPHLGDTCQYNYTAATFGQESAQPRSIVTVQVSEKARRAVHAALDISMFIMTRKPSGQIFYLGTLPRYGQTEETQVGASLENGELLVHLRFNQTPENYTVGGTRLDNGHLHLIEVVRNSTLVQVKLNGTEYFRKSISAAKFIDAQVLYLGGPPPIPQPPAPEALALTAAGGPPAAPAAPPAPTTPAPTPPPIPQQDDSAYFKGVIQDVQISNGVNVSIVEFFPLRVPGLVLPPPFGSVSLAAGGVLAGVVSDDACASHPCLHQAVCSNTWNDFTCACPRGYKGKQCSEVEFCQLQGCPLNSHCRNLDSGYECVSNATFDGVSTALAYRLRVPRSAARAPDDDALPSTLTITYRSKQGGTLFHAANGQEVFSVGVFKEQVSVHWRLGAEAGAGGAPAVRSMRGRSHLHWTTVRFTVTADSIVGSFVDAEGREEAGMSAEADGRAWQRLLADGTIHLGAAPRAAPHTQPPTESSTDMIGDLEYMEGGNYTMDNLDGEFFKGCIGAVHVGALLLPYFTEEELFVGAAAALLAAQPHYALTSGRPWGWAQGVGCVLCLEQDCASGGRCADVRSSYACACQPGYAGDYCQIDIDECANNECQNNSTCKDEVAKYSCICPPGFEGELCERDIDECLSGPCENGGTCVDLVGGFSCACAPRWRGRTCALPHARTCAHRPCAPHAAACTDLPPEPPTGNNFTCTCEEGFEGVYCESAFCEVTPCVHGQCRNDSKPPVCACLAGYSGRLCETERDECAEAGAGACLHGGRCIDAPAKYICDCENTGWRGARCEEDVDECALGLVSCGPGDCRNLDGSYTCVCTAGFCGDECALRDPCYEPAEAEEEEEEGGAGGNGTRGPCRRGGRCEQRCAAATDYHCHCTDGWGGKNCTQQVVSEQALGGGARSPLVVVAVCAALAALGAAGAALAALGAQARRKRATRGTYSPSGQEYCNPRAEMMHQALKPPPEERLI